VQAVREALEMVHTQELMEVMELQGQQVKQYQ
jgi:hypothetical protein